MGQCVSRKGVGSYAPIISTDTLSIGSGVHPRSNGTRRARQTKGHSESKGAKKRSTPRGVATSFGFRKRPASSSRISNKSRIECDSDPADGTDNDVTRRRSKTPNSLDKNGNGGSPVTSGRSTPLARPRKEVAGAPLRTNRFGFRQTGHAKTAKVGDVNATIEQGFNFTHEEKQTFNIPKTEDELTINNNPLGKSSNKATNGQVTVRKSSDGTVKSSPDQPVRTTTKQTVILTYTTHQTTTQPNVYQRNRSVGANRTSEVSNPNPRSKSASRAYPTTGSNPKQFEAGKYTFQTTQLPKPQLPSVTVLDTKNAKQVANNCRKVYGSAEYTNKSGASVNAPGSNQCEKVSTQSSVGVQPDDADAQSKPRRPRNLEMVMRNAHSFHLRELQVTDLDIMDEAVITDSGVIPLPKLPSALIDNEEIPYPASKAFADWQASRERSEYLSEPQKDLHHILNNSTSNRIEELQNRLSAADIHLRNNWMDEEKGNRDRIQHEKKAAFMNVSVNAPPRAHSPLTRSSSKESSPSSRSEGTNGEQNISLARSAGEAMARRSQDDISTELSISSCDDERPKNEVNTLNGSVVPQTTISIIDFTLNDISKPIKYLDNFSSQVILPSMLMSTSTLSGSIFSNTSGTITNLTGDSLPFMIDNNKFDLAALETSTHSMLDDETSPVDSLISSSSDSNNDLANVDDKEHLSISSSAYQTANTKSKSADANQTNIDIDFEVLEDIIQEDDSPKKSKDTSPLTPGTPTNASNSLSLSDGRDFLIDDEIADQPGLIFENNSSADHGTPSKEMEERDRITSPKKFSNSPPAQVKKKAPARTPSLDTLSSIGSDDLMMDLELGLGRSITSLQSGDDYQDKVDGSVRSHLSSIDDTHLRQEFANDFSTNKYSALKHWNHLLDQNMLLDKQLAAMGHHLTHSNSTSSSSIANIGASLPARTARLLSRSRFDSLETSRAHSDAGSVASSGRDSAGGGRTPRPTATCDRDLRLDRQSHAAMLQDVVAIKTLLLKLKRVLQEPEEEFSLSTETLDPLSLEASQSNGLFLRLAESEVCAEGEENGKGGADSTTPVTPAHHREELADLRRQIVFLQSQLEDRERVVKHLQEQMNKCSDSSDSSRINGHSSEEMCNVATQTERLRPLSTGPNVLQNISDGHAGLVSWSEHKKTASETSSNSSRLRKPSSQSSVQTNSGSVQCQCVLKKLNGFYTNSNSNAELDNKVSRINSMDNINHIMANGRVGSRYLLAIAGKQPNCPKYPRRDAGCGEKAFQSGSPYGCRSRSIEMLPSNLSSNASRRMQNGRREASSNSLRDERRIARHNSYGDLLNGESDPSAHGLNGHRRNGNANGQSTDTDDNSDSGYKSLPPALATTHRRLSGIPRRSEDKAITARSYRIS